MFLELKIKLHVLNYLSNNRSMVLCDYCGDFFHLECVSLSEMEAKQMPHYKCPQCTKEPNIDLIYEEGIANMNYVTQR